MTFLVFCNFIRSLCLTFLSTTSGTYDWNRQPDKTENIEKVRILVFTVQLFRNKKKYLHFEICFRCQSVNINKSGQVLIQFMVTNITGKETPEVLQLVVISVFIVLFKELSCQYTQSNFETWEGKEKKLAYFCIFLTNKSWDNTCFQGLLELKWLLSKSGEKIE